MPCLPLSEIMCSSKHICNSGYQKVFESACLTVEHVTHWALPCSSDLMFIYCIEQHQFLKCIGPVGARASSDTVPVPVVLIMQRAKTLGFHPYLKLKILLSTTDSNPILTISDLKSPLTCIRITLVSLIPLPSQQCFSFMSEQGHESFSFESWKWEGSKKMYVLVKQGSTVGDGRMSADVMTGALCRQMTWGMVFWMECVIERKLLHSPPNQLLC